MKHEGGRTTSMLWEYSSGRCFPSCGVTTGFLIQSISTRKCRNQVVCVNPRLSWPEMSPLAIVSATFSQWPEHLLVSKTDTIDIVPLATSSSALSTVHVYKHLLEHFLNEWQVPALSQKITYVFLPNKEMAVSSPCSAAKDSNNVVELPWFEIQVGFPGHTNLTKVLLVKYTPAPLCRALLRSCTPDASVYMDI